MTTSGDSQTSGAAPLDVHSTRASIAGVYDAALGGTDNYEIDRQVLAQVREVAPEVNDPSTRRPTSSARSPGAWNR